MDDLKVVSFNVNGLNVPTKRRAIYDQLRSSKADICLLQETHCVSSLESIWATEWGGRVMFSNRSSSSRGVAILFASDFLPPVQKVFQDPNGRFILIDIVLHAEIYTVGCFYAPTQDKPQDQAAFMDSVEAALDSMTNINLILGGDFNCILDPAIDKNSTSQLPATTDLYRSRLKTFIEDRNLNDLFRIRFPSKKAFTFRRGSYASRLDLILLSTHLSGGDSQPELKVSTQSDHSIRSLQVHKTTQVRGPGLWKFNPALLENGKYIQMMTDFLTQWREPPELSTPCTVWEWLKYEIKTATIRFSKENVPLERQMIRDLSKSLQDLTRRADGGEDVSDQIASTRRELGEMEEIRASRLISRAHTKWTMLGEKPSAYYLNLEKRKLKNKALSTILLEDGSTTSEPRKILEECNTFYQKLYQESSDSLTPLDDIIQEVEPLITLSSRSKSLLLWTLQSPRRI